MMGGWLDWGCRAGEVKGRNAYCLVQRDLPLACLLLLLAVLLSLAWRDRLSGLLVPEAGLFLLGCILYAAAWRLGFRRLALFDRERRTFRLESRFLLLFHRAEEGALDEIRWVRWRDPAHAGHADAFHAREAGVAIGYRDQEVTVAEWELGAGEDDALALANWLRRPYLREGESPAPAPSPAGADPGAQVFRPAGA